MSQPVVHWEIGAKDPGALQEFYAKIFDWKISTQSGDYRLVEAAEGGIGGGIFPLEENMPPYITFYVQVDDLQVYLDKIESLGGKTIVPPTEIPDTGSFAMFADPEGHFIGLFK